MGYKGMVSTKMLSWKKQYKIVKRRRKQSPSICKRVRYIWYLLWSAPFLEYWEIKEIHVFFWCLLKLEFSMIRIDTDSTRHNSCGLVPVVVAFINVLLFIKIQFIRDIPYLFSLYAFMIADCYNQWLRYSDYILGKKTILFNAGIIIVCACSNVCLYNIFFFQTKLNNEKFLT